MSEYTMSIDGQQQRAQQTFDVINPATEEVLGQAPECTEAQLEDALQSAQRAFGSWRRDEDARRKLLLTAAERLAAKAPEIARTLTQEQGKPLAQATIELQTAAASLKGAAALPIPHEVTQDDARAKVEVTHRPFGVVAAITPWNFPVMIAMSKVAPALLAGNTVVLKPSPYTPLATLQVGSLLSEVFPAGVLNVVSGGNALGAKLTGHPLVRMISFTGSVATGLKVGEVAARDLKRTILELGGNDPAIVLPDADIERFAQRLFWSTFWNCGQICLAVKRVFVHESQHEQLLAALTKLAQSVQVGDGLEQNTQMGPVNNLMQLERVIELTEDAKKNGAKVHAGGERLGRKGYFYPPTILSNVHDNTRIVAEEQFGPVLPILSYREVDEAVSRANATQFGLGASVWGTDVERATQIARQIDAGTVWVNQHVSLTHKAPFTGAKSSGIGLASGRWGLASFLQTHVINVSRG
jgi:acyl-CoA reductase-like NAD-dependent aldehyde dehydrogenase